MISMMPSDTEPRRYSIREPNCADRKTSRALPRKSSLNLLEPARCKPTLTRIGGSAGIVELLDGGEQGRHAIDGRYPVSNTPIVVDAPRECAFHDGESCRSDRNFKARAP
jgi:hypothetical protein